MLAWPRVLFGSGVLNGMLDKVVASFFIGSIGFDGGAAAGRGPGVGASSGATFVEDTHERAAARRRSVFMCCSLAECERGKHKGHWRRPYAIVSENFQHLQ
jgi:hypothetical protein